MRRTSSSSAIPSDAHRAVARTAVETLPERLPDLVLSVEPETPAWRPSIWMRGLTALPVQFTSVVQ